MKAYYGAAAAAFLRLLPSLSAAVFVCGIVCGTHMSAMPICTLAGAARSCRAGAAENESEAEQRDSIRTTMDCCDDARRARSEVRTQRCLRGDRSCLLCQPGTEGVKCSAERKRIRKGTRGCDKQIYCEAEAELDPRSASAIVPHPHKLMLRSILLEKVKRGKAARVKYYITCYALGVRVTHAIARAQDKMRGFSTGAAALRTALFRAASSDQPFASAHVSRATPQAGCFHMHISAAPSLR